VVLPFCSVVESDVETFAEQWSGGQDPFSETASARTPPSRAILKTFRETEEFWDQLLSKSSEDEIGQLLRVSIEDLDKRIASIQAEVEAAKDAQQRGRAALLNELCLRRRRAAGAEKTSSSFMRSVQVASAVADAQAKSQQQAAAQDAVRLRPWLAKEALEFGGVEEGEVRLTLDHRRLLDLSQFDSTAAYRATIDTATAAVWARFEAQKAAWNQAFDEERQQLEHKIQEVHEEDQVEQRKHEFIVAGLMAKIAKHQEMQRKEAAVGRGLPKAKNDSSLRASIIGSHSAAPSQGGHGGRRAGITQLAAGINNGNSAAESTKKRKPKAKCEVDKKLDLMRDICGEALSESTPVRRWGATLVNQLGLNLYPTKPNGFDSSIARSKKMSLVPPRVARSLEEAFSIEPETEESRYLTRYMLGFQRINAGTCDPQLHSPAASASASIALPAGSASERLPI